MCTEQCFLPSFLSFELIFLERDVQVAAIPMRILENIHKKQKRMKSVMALSRFYLFDKLPNMKTIDEGEMENRKYY